jgi:WD40 repeat protein
MLFVGGDDCNIHVYSVEAAAGTSNPLTESHVIQGGHLKPVQSLSLSHGGTMLAAADVRDVCIYSTSDYSTIFSKGRWCFHTQRIGCLAWSPDDTVLASGGNDDDIFLWCIAKKMKRMVDLTFNLVVSELAKLKSTKPEANLSNQKEQLAWSIAYEFAITTFKDRELKLLCFGSLDDFKTLFHKVRADNEVSFAGAIAISQINADEQAVRTSVKALLTDLVPKMSFVAWQKRSEENILRSINREIAIRYEKRVQTASQEATANAITQGAGVGENTTVKQLLDKQFKAYTKKFESQLRAKYSADPKSQGSNARNNGRNSSKQAKRSHSNSPQSLKKKKQAPKTQTQQNGNQTPKTQQKQSRKRKAGNGDHGGAASGGSKKRSRKR